jgi:hypothetical protein
MSVSPEGVMKKRSELLQQLEELSSETLAKRMAGDFSRSWCMQGREERKRRMTFILRMAEELAAVRSVTNFSTGLAEMAIEAVIKGDLDELRDLVGLFSEEGLIENAGAEEGPRYAKIFAKFRETAEEALLTAGPSGEA